MRSVGRPGVQRIKPSSILHGTVDRQPRHTPLLLDGIFCVAGTLVISTVRYTVRLNWVPPIGSDSPRKQDFYSRSIVHELFIQLICKK